MPELKDVSLETFRPLIGEEFVIHVDENAALEVTLRAANALADQASPAGRLAFSILFEGPLEPILPQRIYALDHPGLGRLELFLVPLQPEAGKTRYEAIFT
jgi:hypothetical protein